ncbi:MAG: flagellar basal-body rod protein FlgG [Actinobacteria bacterium]|nr:flagellar basal-body rod protein FlgG [Actinomycetota bacterium]
MIRSLKNSASGINAQQARIDNTSNNIAGANVDAFKSQRSSFADLVYAKLAEGGRPVVARPGEKPLYGSGARMVANNRDFEQGPIRQTDKKTDLAIDGKGFFKIEMPDGSTAYSRNGNFSLDAGGKIVNDQGCTLYPEITLPGGSHEMIIESNGSVKAKMEDGSVSDLGTITLYKFVNPNGLKSLGNNLYAATGAEGPEEEGTPGKEGFGVVIQGALESSNVDLAVEMTDLLESQRIYQLNARALRTSDEMWGMANNLRK